MKKVLIIGFALVLLTVGYLIAGPFDFHTTTRDKYNKIAVVGPIFSTEMIDSAEVDTSDWFKIADYKVATFSFEVVCSNSAASGFAGTGTTATLVLALDLAALKDSSKAAHCPNFDTLITADSHDRQVVYTDLTNYAFPFARLIVTRIDTFGVMATINWGYVGLKLDDAYKIKVRETTGGKWEYDTDNE